MYWIAVYSSSTTVSSQSHVFFQAVLHAEHTYRQYPLWGTRSSRRTHHRVSGSRSNFSLILYCCLPFFEHHWRLLKNQVQYPQSGVEMKLDSYTLPSLPYVESNKWCTLYMWILETRSVINTMKTTSINTNTVSRTRGEGGVRERSCTTLL